jgi:hypothetical protein
MRFSAAAELRAMNVAVHPCLCSRSDISAIPPTARTVLAAPKAGNLERHLEKADPKWSLRPTPADHLPT